MKVNPSVRIYDMHAEHHIPLDFRVYSFDIEQANTKEPSFQLMTSMKKDFNLKNLSPS